MTDIGIYKITSPTGRVYIGQSWNIRRRFNQYKKLDCKVQRLIFRSLSKYGVDNHVFEIIHHLPKDVSQEVMDSFEVLYWNLYRSCGIRMLNLQEPGRGGKPCEETRRLLSLSHMGNKHNVGKKLPPGVIAKMITARTGLKRSEETKKKQSEAAKRRIRTPEHCANMRGKTGPKKGHKHPPETLEKIRRQLIARNKMPRPCKT